MCTATALLTLCLSIPVHHSNSGSMRLSNAKIYNVCTMDSYEHTVCMKMHCLKRRIRRKIRLAYETPVM